MTIAPPATEIELRKALALLMDRPELTTVEVDHRIDTLIRYAGEYGFSLDHCLLAREGDRVVASTLCVDSPGRTTSVFLPPMSRHRPRAGVVAELLEEAVRRAASRNIQLLQALIEPTASDDADVLHQAGFKYLTQLIYLEYDARRNALRPRPVPVASWVTYSPQTHAAFAETLQQTYQDSLDCTGLNGLRSIEDIMASHRSTGRHDPDSWLMALHQGKPAGVLLLSHMPAQASLEVVYMGLTPEARGRGLGYAFLVRAVDEARSQGLHQLTLTVDATNTPALRLYRKFGFGEVSRRDAWIRTTEAFTTDG